MQRATRHLPLVLVLWLALLHVVQPSPAVPVSLRSAERMGMASGTWTFQNTQQTIASGPRVVLPRSGGPRMARISTPPASALLHATRVAGVTAIVRDHAPTASGSPSTSPAWLPQRDPGLLASAARRTLAQHQTTTHRLAAHGGALPYFPTAPPFPG